MTRHPAPSDAIPTAPSPSSRLYGSLAPIYDVIYGLMLRPGRRVAMTRLAPAPGESILEVGVGTGLGALEYPRWCRVIAIDLSESMLRQAKARLSRHRVPHVGLCRMNAAHLAFPDASFDAVYAPYLINVVADPIAVAREMLRVCRPGGRVVLLNHFDGVASSNGAFDRLIGRMAHRLSGVDWHLDLGGFLRDTGLEPTSIEPVNVPRVSSVMLCYKPAAASMREQGLAGLAPAPHSVQSPPAGAPLTSV